MTKDWLSQSCKMTDVKIEVANVPRAAHRSVAGREFDIPAIGG